MPNIIKIFFAVQKLYASNQFVNILPWRGYLYKENWHKTISLIRSCQFTSACQKLSKYSRWFESYISISVSENFASARLLTKKSDIRKSQWLGLVNIYLHNKYYQNIPNGLKVIHHIQFLKILPWRGYL